jgi:hypothetical protein
MAEPPKIYIDSCCFVDAAKQSIGNLPNLMANEVWYLWKFFEAHKDGDVILYTSILSIAECTHADGNMDERIRSLFTRLLLSGEHVRLVQVTPFIASDARDLRWKHNINLRGVDYIHAACGLDRKCIEFLTTDDKVLKASSKLDMLGMKPILPSKTSSLPDKYLQGNLLDAKVTPIKQPKGR